MEAKLVVVGGEAKAGEIRLKLPTVIGRGREASLMVPHPLVSRRHCEIYEQDGLLIVRDLGSLNGTYINNEKVVGEANLPPGQLLTIGAVTFRAMYEVGGASPGEGESGGPSTNLSETVYAGDGPKPVDRARRERGTQKIKEPQRAPTTHTQAASAAADVTLDAATGGAKQAANESDPELEHVRLDESWDDLSSAPADAAESPTEKQNEQHSSDSDDMLNDFLRNLK